MRKACQGEGKAKYNSSEAGTDKMWLRVIKKLGCRDMIRRAASS